MSQKIDPSLRSGFVRSNSTITKRIQGLFDYNESKNRSFTSFRIISKDNLIMMNQKIDPSLRSGLEARII